MRRDRFADIGIGVGVKMTARLAQITGTGNHVESVGNDTRLNDRLAVLVEVEPPWVGSAVRDHLEHLAGRVVAPEAGIDGDTHVVPVLDLSTADNDAATIEIQVDLNGAMTVSPVTTGLDARMTRAGSAMPRNDQSCWPVLTLKAISWLSMSMT